MFGLYRAVTSRGGFINRPHARKNLSMVEIFREMANHYDGHTYTDIGTLLLNTYEKTFSEYEEEHPQDRNVAKCAVCGDAPPRCRKTGFGCESTSVANNSNGSSDPTKPRDWRLCAACGILTHAKCQTASSINSSKSPSVFACDACVTGATAVLREERRRARDAANVKGGGAGNKHAAGRRDREREKRDRERREADKQIVEGLGAASPGRKRSRGGEQVRSGGGGGSVDRSGSNSRPLARPGGLMPNVADAVAEAAAEMVAEESADRRRAEEAVSAAAAAVGGAQLAGSGLGVGHHGFTRDFGYHHEYQGAAGAAGGAPGGYGPPRYVQGYPQGFAYHSFPQPTAHPHGAHQSNHQRTSGTGLWHAPPPSVGPDADAHAAAQLYAKQRSDRAPPPPPLLHADPHWVRFSTNNATNAGAGGPSPPESKWKNVTNDSYVKNEDGLGLGAAARAQRGFKRGGSGDRGARRMVLRPDGALVETTGVDDESPETLQGLSRDSPESPGDSTDPGMSVLTSLAAAPTWMPSASEANLLQRLNDELKETRENSNSPRGTDGAIPRKGSDPRLVLGEMRNPSLSRFSEMERSDSLCSLGVYDSQFWSSVLDNGPDVLGSDPAA